MAGAEAGWATMLPAAAATRAQPAASDRSRSELRPRLHQLYEEQYPAPRLNRASVRVGGKAARSSDGPIIDKAKRRPALSATVTL